MAILQTAFDYALTTYYVGIIVLGIIVLISLIRDTIVQGLNIEELCTAVGIVVLWPVMMIFAAPRMLREIYYKVKILWLTMKNKPTDDR